MQINSPLNLIFRLRWNLCPGIPLFTQTSRSLRLVTRVSLRRRISSMRFMRLLPLHKRTAGTYSLGTEPRLPVDIQFSISTILQRNYRQIIFHARSRKPSSFHPLPPFWIRSTSGKPSVSIADLGFGSSATARRRLTGWLRSSSKLFPAAPWREVFRCQKIELEKLCLLTK